MPVVSFCLQRSEFKIVHAVIEVELFEVYCIYPHISCAKCSVKNCNTVLVRTYKFRT